jgi:hypothetical protein
MTILYRIPNKYFPAVTVKKPFHAKVQYDIVKGEAKIFDVCLSPLCLTHIDNTRGLIEQIKEDLETAARNTHVNPVMMQAMVPFIK